MKSENDKKRPIKNDKYRILKLATLLLIIIISSTVYAYSNYAGTSPSEETVWKGQEESLQQSLVFENSHTASSWIAEPIFHIYKSGFNFCNKNIHIHPFYYAIGTSLLAESIMQGIKMKVQGKF